jgi:hypothetical protein
MLEPVGVILAAEEPGSGAIRKPEIDAALKSLKADPNLATTREVRTLRWISDDDEKAERPSWFNWIGNLFGWIAEVSRVLMWTVIAVLVGLLALYLTRVVKTFDGKRGGAENVAPTHVRDLDIRPESLPDDIGAAAWSLWERGEHRGALSLLYRGLLSRLVHAHAVPIRDSSTEGDCLALAERHLPPDRHGYISQLIRTWQRAVYGGEDPLTPDMRVLCEQFARALQASAPAQDSAT